MPKVFPLSDDALLVLAEFFSPKQIANQLNIANPNTVSSKLYRLRNAYKVNLRRKRKLIKKQHASVALRNQEIIRLKKATLLGPTSIAKQLNLSKNTVIGVLYRERQRYAVVPCGPQESRLATSGLKQRVRALTLTHY